jgi:hypothetical protein
MPSRPPRPSTQSRAREADPIRGPVRVGVPRTLRMRGRARRVILLRMEDSGPDRRRSASINAVLVLVFGLIPVLGSLDTSSIDHTELRPWGCRTCSVPSAPTPVDQDADPL